MTPDLTPDGYIGIWVAIKKMANIPDYTNSDGEWLDIGDRLNDAEALAKATERILELLSDGSLTAYTRGPTGKKVTVHKWAWTDINVWIGERSAHELFRDFQIFSDGGIKLGSDRTPAFFLVEEFQALLHGDLTPKKPKIPKVHRIAGRPKGSGSFNDERWLNEMELIVSPLVGPMTAANSVIATFKIAILRKTGSTDESVAHRLTQKYIKSGRPNPSNLSK